MILYSPLSLNGIGGTSPELSMRMRGDQVVKKWTLSGEIAYIFLPNASIEFLIWVHLPWQMQVPDRASIALK